MAGLERTAASGGGMPGRRRDNWLGFSQPLQSAGGYDHVADFSVYVAREYRGSGVGGRLLDELELRARELGYHKLVLAAFPFNKAGMALYKRNGFREVGTYKEQGLLDGAWVDVVVMEKLLN